MEGDGFVSRGQAVGEVRMMASQFADLYFTFVDELRGALGDGKARRIVKQVLFRRALERAEQMVFRARDEGLPRTPENIRRLSDVLYLGWVPELGADHCPYGERWKRLIEEQPWFREYAALYCEVTDTTIAEAFTGSHSHELLKNVVLGDERCERRYFPCEETARGRYSHAPESREDGA